MKKKFLLVSFLFTICLYSQEKGDFFGGFESNSQWYLNDKDLGVTHPDYPLRSNNYLFLNYNYKNWSAGIQGEMYEDTSLLNYNPKFDGTNVATYFVQYKNNKIDVTVGYFYEQFGNGTLFRGWEDRALGINNALRGGRVIYKPSNSLTFKGIYGQQRSGFDVSKGQVFGFDSEINFNNLLKLETSNLTMGFSYVGRDEKTDIVDPNFNSLTNAFGGRFNFTHNSFYLSSEYDYKSKDAIIVINAIDNDFVKPGNALLINAGYSKKGLGIDATVRRMENMSFYSEREPDIYVNNGGASSFNFNDKILNYIPGLTKQHHYNLSNIYVYQAQTRVDFPDPSVLKAGEIGGQFDIFYDFKKGSKLGGKYGTKVDLNISTWYNLSGDFTYFPSDYKTDFIGFGEKYYTDYNLEVTKKINDKWQANFAYINQFYNKKFIEGGEIVRTNILAGDATYKFGKTKSLRFQAEHLWADADKKNWASSTIEFNANQKLSFYCSDMYNYGNDNKDLRHNYYNIGGAYRKKSTRISLNYGRQRGGLLCVGGVCRVVPESSGISLSLNTSF